MHGQIDALAAGGRVNNWFYVLCFVFKRQKL